MDIANILIFLGVIFGLSVFVLGFFKRVARK